MSNPNSTSVPNLHNPNSNNSNNADAQIADISAKIEVERKVLQGTSAMYRQLADPQAREACEANMVESKRRLEYLESMLRDVVAGSMHQQHSHGGPPNGPVIPPRSSSGSHGSLHSNPLPPTPIEKQSSHLGVDPVSMDKSRSQQGSVGNLFKFGRSASNMEVGGGYNNTAAVSPAGHSTSGSTLDLLKYGSAITTEKVKYRLQEITHKLDTEQKVKTGTDNLLQAMVNLNTGTVDQRVAGELREKMTESNAKIAVLEKARHRYSALYVAPVGGDDDDGMIDVRRKCTGRLRIKLIGASNLVGRTATQNEIISTVAIDGNLKYTSRRSSTRWDETLDVQVDRAQEVEICVYSYPGGMLLGLVWFRLSDLEDDLKMRYPGGVPSSVNDVDDMWLDLEPAGQVLIRTTFMGMTKTKTERDAVFRRGAVQKAFPRNGHKFYAVQSLLYQCAVCNEFSGPGTQWYQCQGCNYMCHAKCYPNVITKCITPSDIKNAKPDDDLNTGQLLPYRIPHRFQPKTILLSSWCSHCGSMMGPGARIEKCAECGKCAHSYCKPMVPNFCQLKPEVAITLVAAFEDVERKKHQKELEEAEKAEKVRREMDAAAMAAAQAKVVDPFQEDESDKVQQSTQQMEQMQIEQRRREQRDKDDQQRRQMDEQRRQIDEQRRQMDEQRQIRAEYERRIQEEERIRKEEQRRLFELQQQEQRRLLEAKKRADEERVRQQQQLQVNQLHQPVSPSASQSNLSLAGLAQKNVKLEDFDFLSVLGRGAFGKVMLIEEKATKQLYAMKALKKEMMIQNDDVASAKLEKRIFQKASQSHHPFLVNLHSCFQTDSRLYFVMEYVCGGDLMCHIQEKKRFSQVRAKFYACEVLLALDFFHKNNIIYRDLKLDNILMCPDGHIKVADYGICKENMAYGAVTRTYCGTPDYMAPEILGQHKYGRAVDWWSFGVLIYVMLVGRYPFHGDEESDILEAILSDAIEYPSSMPKDTLNLIQGLLNKDPKRRLGGGRLDAEEVRRHPYFAGVDWDLFMEKKVAPPWKPIIKNEKDVSNFDSEFTREKAALTPISSVLSSVHQNEFKDFDFVADWAGAPVSLPGSRGGSNSALRG